jgi:thiol-disulfide isomerase/thioredoxin
MLRTSLAPLAAGALLLAGCSGQAEPAGSDTPAVALELDELDAAIAGRTPCLLNFWATWCAPCVAELPALDAAAAEHDGLEVLAVSIDLATGVGTVETPEEIDAFGRDRLAAEPTLRFLVHDGRLGPLLERWDLPGSIPVTLALDADGNEVGRAEGQVDEQRLEELARAALGR